MHTSSSSLQSLKAQDHSYLLQNLLKVSQLIDFFWLFNKLLSTLGFYWDDGSLVESQASGGFIKRMNLYKEGTSFKTDEVSYIGLLYHDLMNCQQGIPPGIGK